MSREAKSLKALGVDDGAPTGEATDVRVQPDEGATLELDTGAELSIPDGAVEQPTRVGLRRIEDAQALKLIDRLGSSRTVLSAPYAVTPYQDFQAAVQLLLPIATRSRSVSVGIFILEDEDDETWSELGLAELLEPGLASVSLSRGGIIIAVELDAPDRRPGAGTEPGPSNGTDTDGPSQPAGSTDKLDLLLMIDNSGSMAEEQAKLADVLDDMVLVLTTGQIDPSMPKPKPDFPPVQSLHIGVVSSDMGVNGAPPQKSCGALSFKPDERDTQQATEFLIKPLGDDGVLHTSTVVATAGIWVQPTPGAVPVEKVPGDPACAGIVFPPGQKYVDFQAGVTNPQDAAKRVSCIAKLGKNGCGLEQQLESVLKALTPPDSQIKFSGSATSGVPTPGQGNASNTNVVSGPNRGFLREDAILVVVFLSDEEDCSIPDSSREIFDAMSTAVPGEINVRCGLKENQGRLHPIRRYVDGLRALKPAAYQDRIIVASIVGIPTKEQLGSTSGVITGAAGIQTILNRPDMEFKVQRNMAGTADEPVPTCISPSGSGSAAPARRFLELTKEFGENGAVTSICEPSYANAFTVIIDRVAGALQGLQP
jgi:hypothetical protein